MNFYLTTSTPQPHPTLFFFFFFLHLARCCCCCSQSDKYYSYHRTYYSNPHSCPCPLSCVYWIFCSSSSSLVDSIGKDTTYYGDVVYVGICERPDCTKYALTCQKGRSAQARHDLGGIYQVSTLYFFPFIKHNTSPFAISSHLTILLTFEYWEYGDWACNVLCGKRVQLYLYHCHATIATLWGPVHYVSDVWGRRPFDGTSQRVTQITE